MELHTKEVHFSNVVLALLFVLAGAVLLFWPVKTMEICCQFIGSIVIFYGITRFYMYYKQYHGGSYQVTFHLVVGLLTTAAGLFIFFRPDDVIRLFPYIAGITLLLQSVIKVQQGLEIKRANMEAWKMVMVFAGVNVLAGLLLLFNPFEALEVTLRIIALFLLYEGISECVSLFHLSKAVKGIVKDVDAKIEYKELELLDTKD